MERQGITSVADCGSHYIIGYSSKSVLQRKGPNQATEPELDAMERVIVDFCKLHIKLADPLELSRQRDEAVRLLRYLSRVKGISDTTTWRTCTKGVRTLLDTIDAQEGESNE